MVLIILCSVTSTSLALMVSALCRTTALSVTVLPMILEVTRLFGGFFLAPRRLPKYFSWLDALSYIKYTFVGLSLNEFTGLLDAPSGNITNSTIGGQAIQTGSQLIDDRDYDYINIGGCIGVLLGFIVLCRLLAFLGVRYIKH